MTVTDRIEQYLSLAKERPALFTPSDIYPIVTDPTVIRDFEQRSGKQVGVIYRSPFNTLVVDLIAGENGYFTYERVIPTASGRGVVCVPVVDGKLLMLQQYRHAIRRSQLCFPRGYGENGISSQDNAKKELAEETGAVARECVYLGSVVADSGLIGAECDVYLCTLDTFREDSHEEGITKILLLDEAELESRIQSREIDDGFTLSAYMLYKTKAL